MNKLKDKINTLPTSPGVYIFKDQSGVVIYVGKAASLKDRVSSYFQGRNYYARPIDFAINQIEEIETQGTESVLEAFFLEQSLIKKWQPKYNVLGKDDKSFVYVGVTKGDFPRFEVKRKTDLEDDFSKDKKTGVRYSKVYGPFTSRLLIERALKILRKIFPYHNKPQESERYCLDLHLGLCPGPFAGRISKQDYSKNIRAIELILKGKKQRLVRQLEKEMAAAAKSTEFEKAAQLRNLVFTLRHIQDVAMINEAEKNSPGDELLDRESVGLKKKKARQPVAKVFRIEGYDISNISGQYSVGSMVVFDNSDGQMQPNKSQYRRFRIRTVKGINDIQSMEEVLRRRLSNSWRLPEVILLDGGKGHLNAAKRVLRELRYDIPLLAVAKGRDRKKLELHYYGAIPDLSKEIIGQIRDEAHRFAITYHRKLRGRGLKGE